MNNGYKTPALNPFRTMLLKFNPRRVYGWEREIISILQVVTGHDPHSHAIYGIRAIGKSTLLKFLRHPEGAMRRYRNLVDEDYATGRRQILWIYINFHQFTEQTSVLQVMHQHFYRELTTKTNLDENELEDYSPQTALQKRDVAALIRQMLQWLDKDHRMRVVFLMDDFDIPLMSDSIRPEDDHLLRTISDFASLIIATDEPISQINPEITKASPLLGILRPERIGLINENAARRLICEPMESTGETFLALEENMLLMIAGCHPFLLTMTCDTYFEMRQGLVDIEKIFEKPASRKGIADRLMNKLLVEPGITNVLNLIWNKHKSLQPILVEMAKEQDNGFIGSQAARLEVYSMAYLDVRAGGYRIFGRLFAAFVRLQAAHAHRHDADYDNALQDLMMNLSPIDRSVLEYLVKRKNTVCTFQELIDSVWDDENGTKRALEAAVHRLRRSVPGGHQIKNIRGEGYKYIIVDSALV